MQSLGCRYHLHLHRKDSNLRLMKIPEFIKKTTIFLIWNRPKNIFQVFGNIILNSDTEYNRHVHFQTFHQGLLVLFRWLNEERASVKDEFHFRFLVMLSWVFGDFKKSMSLCLLGCEVRIRKGTESGLICMKKQKVLETDNCLEPYYEW